MAANSASFCVVPSIVGARVVKVDVFVVMLSQINVTRFEPRCLFIYVNLIVITITINKT